MPSASARGFVPFPTAVGATQVSIDGRLVWMTRTPDGTVRAIDAHRVLGIDGFVETSYPLLFAPRGYVPSPWDACYPDGMLYRELPYRHPWFPERTTEIIPYGLDGTRWYYEFFLTGGYPVTTRGNMAEVGLGNPMAHGDWSFSGNVPERINGVGTIRSAEECAARGPSHP